MNKTQVFIKSVLVKSGPGSRGGHVIGHTKTSGLPIYASSHSKNQAILQSAKDDNHSGAVAAITKHPGYGAKEHIDAAEHHQQVAEQTTDHAERSASHKLSQAHAEASILIKRNGHRSPE